MCTMAHTSLCWQSSNTGPYHCVVCIVVVSLILACSCVKKQVHFRNMLCNLVYGTSEDSCIQNIQDALESSKYASDNV